jgi:hypothetical protein
MTHALIYKELRETLPIVALGLAALLIVASSSMGFSPLPLLVQPRARAIPFINDPFTPRYIITAGSLAIALGIWQALGDFRGEAQFFLLHRPASRRSVYLTKLATGLAVYLLCGFLPIALYAAWAAAPGTHASPFVWSMTAFEWLTWLALTSVYLGAFLAGIRPAAWVGTRLTPLVAAMAAVFFVSIVLPNLAGVALIALLDAALVAAILLAVETRDFT